MDMRTWWQQAVVYQVYPRSFQSASGRGIGDLQGIVKRLDYLKTLGVDVLWLSPIYRSGGVDGGYDISDYRCIDPAYGTMADFEYLLQQSHLRGIRVILDLVVNHTSNQHAWFVESRSSTHSAKRNWYIWRDGYHGGPPNGLQSVFSGSTWTLDETTGQYYLHLFAKEQPDLNWDEPEVRRAVYDMMKWWLDKGIDGFRMDVISLISKPEAALISDGGPDANVANGPCVHDYLQEMRREVLSRYDVMTVGETPGVTVEEARRYAGLCAGELNMVFQFDLMDVDNDPVTGKWTCRRPALADIRRVMTRWQTGLSGTAWNSLFLGNHDQPRAVSRFGDTRTPLLWEKSAKMLATCLYMMQGTPFLYQGEELGMTNMPVHALADCQDVETFRAYREWVEEKKIYTPEEMLAAIRLRGRDNARTPMQWSAEENAGFSVQAPWLPVNPNHRDINAEQQMADPDSVFHHYRRLIGLRRQYPVIVYGTYALLLPEDEHIYAYERCHSGWRVTVLCNFTDQTIQGGAWCGLIHDAMEILLGNYPAEAARHDALHPYEARVYLEALDRGGKK